jgi:glycosyltransferase involved in cell wall biosynthesis
MRILLSAFACAPKVGSENGVGWMWAIELAKRGHEVHVLTDISRREQIQKEENTPHNLHFYFYRPSIISGLSLNSKTAHLIYIVWQYCLLFYVVKKFDVKKFDFMQHLTYGVFRHPCFLGVLGVPLVFGPLGGGEDAPLKLKKSIVGIEKLKEYARFIMNKLALIDPFLWLSYFYTDLIFAKTQDTERAIPKVFRSKVVVHTEIGFDYPVLFSSLKRREGSFHVIYAGRLLGWKGVHLLIKSVSLLRAKKIDINVTVIGDGSYGAALKKMADGYGVSHMINWIEKIPQVELFKKYLLGHCFIFPSLHDSSGNVVLEAQGHGLPVICLNLGGPPILVSASSAFVIDTFGKSEDDIAACISEKIIYLYNNEDERFLMANAAVKHVSENMSWSRCVDSAVTIVSEKIFKNHII